MAWGGGREAEARKLRRRIFWPFIIAGNFHVHEIHHKILHEILEHRILHEILDS
jgi:hypothetical protein